MPLTPNCRSPKTTTGWHDRGPALHRINFTERLSEEGISLTHVGEMLFLTTNHIIQKFHLNVTKIPAQSTHPAAKKPKKSGNNWVENLPPHSLQTRHNRCHFLD